MALLDLTKPTDARIYVKDFEVPGHPKPEYVDLSTGRRIYFNSMTDDDAILVANLLYQIDCQAESMLAREMDRLQ